MKALSILQPWASLVVMGEKKIETRSWNTQYRGLLLIHASKGEKKAYQNLCADENLPFGQYIDPYAYKCLDFGAIIGAVKVVDTCPTGINVIHSDTFFAGDAFDRANAAIYLTRQEHAFGNYEEGRYGWLLSDPVMFDEPIPCKGNLGIWNVPADVAAIVDRALAANETV